MDNISLKTLVDKENNRVIYAESSGDFVDVLFSFLTMPMGTIIKLISDVQLPKIKIGSMNNLYESVGLLDSMCFRTEACQPMLLNPQNAAANYCKILKIKIGGVEPPRFFLCSKNGCAASGYKLLSHYWEVYCGCGNKMAMQINLTESQNVDSNERDGGVFVHAVTRHLVTDELKVIPLSTTASFSLLSKLGVTVGRKLEERTINVGTNEVLKLLKCLFVSKTPLTEALLKQAVPEAELQKVDFGKISSIKQQYESRTSNGDGDITLKLIFSKSKKKVCYAEVSEGFVDLLFSFLTIPLGFILKEMHGAPAKGCLHHLYNSIKDPYFEKNLKSDEHKQMLLSPKIAPGFRYQEQLLDLEEAANKQYYYAELANDGWYTKRQLTTDRTHFSSNVLKEARLTVLDPKSSYKKPTRGEGSAPIPGKGFLKAPAMFMVTDDLIISLVSPISGLSILNKLKVPFGDIEERVVHLGREDASRLLVASFISDSVLTDVFIGNESKIEQEYSVSVKKI